VSHDEKPHCHMADWFHFIQKGKRGQS
jgi:hypothetical protein